MIVNKPVGAFYFTVMFEPGVLNDSQSLTIENRQVRERIEAQVTGVPADKRFVYYLMGATGIVVVPLTGFHCHHPGFRATLLEHDDEKRKWMLQTLRRSIQEYTS